MRSIFYTVIFILSIISLTFSNGIKKYCFETFDKKKIIKCENQKNFWDKNFNNTRLINLSGVSEDTIYKRNAIEKISTVAFYTVTGFLLFLPIDRYIIHGGKGDDGLGTSLGMFYESLIYGGGSGLVAGIIIVSFDLDKPFRKKHRRAKK